MITFGALIAFLFNVTIGMPLFVAGLIAVVIGGRARLASRTGASGAGCASAAPA